MRDPMKLLPNALSASRLGLVPVLWALALGGQASALGIGLIAAGATDLLDGFLARRLDAVTATGAALDSLADNLLILSVAAWLVLLRPDVVAHFAVWFSVVVTLHVAFLVIGMVKFRRFGNLHFYSGKAAAVAGLAFAVACFLGSGIPVVLGVMAFSLATVAVVEGLACQILCQRIDERFGSVFRALQEQEDRCERRSTGRGR